MKRNKTTMGAATILSIAGLVVGAAGWVRAVVNDRVYSGLDGGLYNTAGNWTPADVPNTAAERAVIGDDRSVLLNTGPTLGGLSVGAGATVTRDSATSRTVKIAAASVPESTFLNAGTISSGSDGVTSGTLTLQMPTGTVNTVCANSGTFVASSGTTFGVGRIASAGAWVMDNNGGTWRTEGSGTISLSMGGTNTGGRLLIGSSGSFVQPSDNGTTTLVDMTVTNSGTWVMRGATGSGNTMNLVVTNAPVANAGTILIACGEGSGAGSVGITFRAGTAPWNTGTIIVTNENVLSSVTAGSYFQFAGERFVNDGDIVVAGGGGGGSCLLRLGPAPDLWLDGSGVISILKSPAAPVGIATIAGHVQQFNIGTNQTLIARDGKIRSNAATAKLSTLFNHGTLVADGIDGGTLQVSPATNFVNVGTVVATNNAVLQFVKDLYGTAPVFTNAGLVWVQSGSLLTNTYAFTQTAGTLQVDGTLQSPAMDVVVAGGTLKGSGSVVTATTKIVDVQSGATVAPGGSVGTLTTRNLTLRSGTLL